MLPDPRIPDYWSPEQALAIYEFLNDLRERIWDRYGEQITEQMRFEYEKQEKRAQLELSLFEDEIPF
jgi:predicted DNA binding CopG/RHH family protein